MEKITLTINGQPVSADKGMTVLDAARLAGGADGHDVGAGEVADGREGRVKGLSGGVEREVADIQTIAHGFSRLV